MSDRAIRLRDLAVSDTGFVFDPLSGATFSTNAVGLALLECLKADKVRDEILAEVASAFEVNEVEDDLGRDLDEFIQLLKRNHILDSDFRLD